MNNKLTKEEKEEINKKTLPSIVQESFEKINPYQQSFVYHYVRTNDKILAIQEARKTYGLGKVKKDIATAEAESFLMKKEVKDAIKEYKNMFNEQTSMAIAKSGLDMVSMFTKLATSEQEVERLDKRIKHYDKLIEEAMVKGNDGAFLTLTQAQMTFIKQKDKAMDSMRKNVMLWNDTSGMGKGKQIIKAGNININMGNQTIGSDKSKEKSNGVIEAPVKEYTVEDLPDIDEL